ncbi:MAG: TetR family transcriptional regulator [Acidimicrobiales bacterium]
MAARAGLPTTAKGQETRQRITDAAAELIYEKGAAAVSLDDVRQATHTSKSQLYHYFEDKNDLVHAVIDRQTEHILAFHRPKLAALSSWDDIQRWRNAIVEAQAGRSCRSGCPLGSLANELAELDDTARTQLSGAFATWEQLLTQGLASMIGSGALRPGTDPAVLALSTMASLQGGLLLAEVERDTRPLEVALDAAISHLKSFAPSH